MKFTYPAIFKKNSEGGYDGKFVDLACCEVSGYSLDDAIRNAIEAEAAKIFTDENRLNIKN